MDKYLKYKNRYIALKNQNGGEYKILEPPYLDRLPVDLSIITQFRYFYKIIECFIINQVFSEFNVDENDFTKEIFKNICEVNLSRLEEEEERWKGLTSRTIRGFHERLIDYPPLEFRKFSNLIDKEALISLYGIKKNFLEDENRVVIAPNKKIPINSVQYIVFGKYIDELYDSINKRLLDGDPVKIEEIRNYSNYILLIPKNRIVKNILEPFHNLGNELIQTKYSKNPKEKKKEDDEDDEDEEYNEINDIWYHNTSTNLVSDLFGTTLRRFTDKMHNFVVENMKNVRDIYVKNPSVELALLLAKLGIPYNIDKILNPPPNPATKMTKEEYKKLKPLFDFINQVEYYVKYDSKNLFTKYFDNIVKRDQKFLDSLVKFKKVKVKLPTGDTFDIDVDSSLTVADVKLIIIDYINENITNAYFNEKNDFKKEPVNSSNYNFMFNLLGKTVIMEDDRSINDYNIMRATNPEITLGIKIKSGLVSFV
jgi:hypothetical protein